MASLSLGDLSQSGLNSTEMILGRTNGKMTALSRLGLWRKNDDVEMPNCLEWTESRLWLMLVIFLVSLFASTFPSMSRRIPGLHIPGVVFFIGKHFGTGIILATAFVHLLQDSYEALMNPVVRARWPGVTDWIGMMVLSSLLLIFLVEYISTSFVDRLHSYPSNPPSPARSSNTTPCSSHSPSPSLVSAPASLTPPISAQSTTYAAAQLPSPASSPSLEITEYAQPSEGSLGVGHTADAPLPLAPPESAAAINDASVDERTPLRVAKLQSSTPAHAHSRAQAYGSTSARPPARARAAYAHTFPRSARAPRHVVEASGTTNATAEEIFAGGHHRHEDRAAHESHHGVGKGAVWRGWFGLGGGEDGHDADHGGDHGDEGGTARPAAAAGKKERGRGRTHTHGHAHGPGHVHMDMEAWGSSSEGEEEGDEGEGMDGEEAQIGRRRQVVGILMLEIGIMLHSLVIGLTLAITSGPEYTSLVTAIIFHQLFEGLSLGIRIATLPAVAAAKGGWTLLKPALTVSFAITTPVGIAIGLGVFQPGQSEGAKITLIRGLMSAFSAGMLIYAACVEMLAGDFVLDPHLWRSSIRRQALALGSLFLGVAAMGAVGILGE